ncbi:MAG TPA: EamA family transporter, partial [Gemmatimonadaceae bacterium]|nr:EamA family transporter [Gemmatimonadaceae bacterium]
MSTSVSVRAGEPRGRVLVAFAAVYVVWGSTYLAIHYGVQTIPPFLLGGVRFLLAGVLLFAWARLRGSPVPSRPEWRAAAMSGLLMLLGGNGAVVWSEQHIASGTVALIVAGVPLWMVLLEWLRPGGGERPRPLVFAGLGLGLAGLVLLIGPDALAHHASGESLGSGALLVPVIGSFFWAAGSLYSRHGARPPSSVLATGIQMLAGGVAFLAASVAAGEPTHFHPGAVSLVSMLGLLYLVAFGSLVGFTAYIYLLRASSPARVSTYAYVNPVVAVLLGWAVAGEPISGRTIAAAAVILAGVALITNGSGRRRR